VHFIFIKKERRKMDIRDLKIEMAESLKNRLDSVIQEGILRLKGENGFAIKNTPAFFNFTVSEKGNYRSLYYNRITKNCKGCFAILDNLNAILLNAEKSRI